MIVSSLLVWKFGLMGAVWSNFLVKPVQAFFLYFESRKIFRFKLNNWKIFYLPLIFIAVVITCQLFTNERNLLWFAAGQLVFSSVMVSFTYRKELLPLIMKLIRR